MMYSGNPTKVLRAINKLLKTETVALQRKFIHFRGLYLLERCLSEHMNTKSIVKHNILLALQMLPISTKNAIVKLEIMVQQMTSAENFGFATAELAKRILESWSGLELVYKIPKRIKGELSEIETSASTSHTSGSGSDLKRVRPVEDESEQALKYHRSSSSNIFSNNKFLEVSSGVVFKEIEEKRLDVSWNQMISTPDDSVRSVLTESSMASFSASQMSESNIEQMVEAAQQASRLRQEALKKKQSQELEEQKKLLLEKKKLIKERKEKQRELSQALGKRLVERAMAESESTPKGKKSYSSSKGKKNSLSSSKEKKPSKSSSNPESSKEKKPSQSSSKNYEDFSSISESEKISIKKLVRIRYISYFSFQIQSLK